MIDGRRFIAAIVGGLVVTAAVYADMVPVSQSDAGRRQLIYDCRRPGLLYTDLSSPSNFPSFAELYSCSVEFLPGASADVSQASEMQQPQILTDGTGSLSLCLCALIGLGLCRTAPWVKKLSFCFVPEWYHNGGPFQIGHSYAVTPESLCPVPAFCFIQPVCMAEDSLTQYRLGTIMSLWRKSQFTPIVLASRGPPDMS
ncbi:MAG: hypothetical protein WAV28_09660 [Sedimentisphaerales bacterium]